MLPTAAIKTDPTASSQATKDKESASASLGADFSSYITQMMAALPPQALAAAMAAVAPQAPADPAQGGGPP